MKKILLYTHDRPLIFGLVVCLVFILMLVVSAVLGNLWPGEISYGQPGAIAGRWIASAILLVILAGLGWLRSGGFRTLGSWKAWLWLPLPLAYTVFASAYTMSGSLNFDLVNPAFTVPVILFILGAAFLEEVTFRGLILHGMVRTWGNTSRGIVQSVTVSSLLFCGIHLLDFLSGRPLLNVLLQSLQAFFLGIFLAALVLKSKSIFPAVFFHAMINLAGYLNFTSQGIEPAPTAWLLLSLVMLPLALYGIFLLRGQAEKPVVMPGARD